jgi:hypothetical protein
MAHQTKGMRTTLKFGVTTFAGAALLFACAVPGWAQRGGGGHAGGGMSGGHVGGGMSHAAVSHAPMSRAPMSRAPMSRPTTSSAPRIAPRMTVARPRTVSVARPTRAATANAGRRQVVTYRNTRDRFGRLHRVRIVSFVGAYPGYFDYPGYYPYDYGYDQSDSSYDQGNYDATQQSAPAAADQTAPAPSQYAAASTDSTIPGVGQLILVRKDGQIVTPNAFAISGDQLVYISRQGARLSFPVSDLDKDTTRKMNQANGTNVAIPD